MIALENYDHWTHEDHIGILFLDGTWPVVCASVTKNTCGYNSTGLILSSPDGITLTLRIRFEKQGCRCVQMLNQRLLYLFSGPTCLKVTYSYLVLLHCRASGSRHIQEQVVDQDYWRISSQVRRNGDQV